MSQPRVHIVLLNWNGWKDTIECLESLMRLDYDNYQIVVCDNASSNDSIEEIQNWAKGKNPVLLSADTPTRIKDLVSPVFSKPIGYTLLNRAEAESGDPVDPTLPMVLIQTGANLGFAGGNNVGLRYALAQGTEYCWMLNNDTLVEPDSLANMVKHSETLSNKGIPNTCGSVQCFYDDPKVIQCLGGFKFNLWTAVSSDALGKYLSIDDSSIDHDAYRAKLDGIHGCSWLLSRSFLEDIGLMDERYFLYYEEIDWALRAKGKYQLTYASDAIVYHKEGQSIGSKSLKKKGSLLSEFYSNRNKYVFAKKFSPKSLPTIFSYLLLQAVNHLRKKEPDKAWMQIRVAFGKQKPDS